MRRRGRLQRSRRSDRRDAFRRLRTRCRAALTERVGCAANAGNTPAWHIARRRASLPRALRRRPHPNCSLGARRIRTSSRHRRRKDRRETDSPTRRHRDSSRLVGIPFRRRPSAHTAWSGEAIRSRRRPVELRHAIGSATLHGLFRRARMSRPARRWSIPWCVEETQRGASPGGRTCPGEPGGRMCRRSRQPERPCADPAGSRTGRHIASDPGHRGRDAGQLHVGGDGLGDRAGRHHHLQLRSEPDHHQADRDGQDPEPHRPRHRDRWRRKSDLERRGSTSHPVHEHVRGRPRAAVWK